MQLFVVLAACAVLSALLAPKIIAYCIQRRLVDEVNHRSLHTLPTPRGGGLGIVLVSLPIATALTLAAPSLTHHSFLLMVLGCSLIVCIAGWLDDHRLLPPWGKLGLQGVAAAIPLYFLPPVFDDLFPMWFDRAFLWLGWVWFMNLYNFMDGADGQATTQAVIIAVGVFFIFPHSASVMLPLAGAALGFLTVNRPKAKIYLGDIGSSYLGYMLAGGIITAIAADVNHAVPATIISFYFICDATYTTLKRALKGEKFWQAHRQFWFQRAYQQGLSHGQLLWGMLKLNAALALVAYLGVYFGWGWWAFIPGMIPILYAAAKIRHLEGPQR